MAKKERNLQALAEQIKSLPETGKLITRLSIATTEQERDKVLDEARELLQSGDSSSTLETIRRLTKEIDALKFDIKALNEMLKDIRADLPEFEALEDARVALQQAQTELNEALRKVPNYNDNLEELAGKKESLSDKQAILSAFIVEYHAQTHEKQVEIDQSNGDARALVLTGRLGKKQKYQTSLFNPAPEPLPAKKQTEQTAAAL